MVLLFLSHNFICRILATEKTCPMCAEKLSAEQLSKIVEPAPYFLHEDAD